MAPTGHAVHSRAANGIWTVDLVLGGEGRGGGGGAVRRTAAAVPARRDARSVIGGRGCFRMVVVGGKVARAARAARLRWRRRASWASFQAHNSAKAASGGAFARNAGIVGRGEGGGEGEREGDEEGDEEDALGLLCDGGPDGGGEGGCAAGGVGGTAAAASGGAATFRER